MGNSYKYNYVTRNVTKSSRGGFAHYLNRGREAVLKAIREIYFVPERVDRFHDSYRLRKELAPPQDIIYNGRCDKLDLGGWC